MKRFHVHVTVNDLDQSIRFYSGLFGESPSVTKDDYAKWMLDDPAVNFAISNHRDEPGINHLGLQVDSGSDLAALKAGLSQADVDTLDEPDANCCYAQSDKHWTKDPQGIVWEAFHTHGDIRTYGTSPGLNTSACCTGA